MVNDYQIGLNWFPNLFDSVRHGKHVENCRGYSYMFPVVCATKNLFSGL